MMHSMLSSDPEEDLLELHEMTTDSDQSLHEIVSDNDENLEKDFALGP